jgi:hypothetical protein
MLIRLEWIKDNLESIPMITGYKLAGIITMQQWMARHLPMAGGQ